MSPVSEKQRKAMWSAAEGKSNIGIPKKVGKEFAKADPGGKLPKKAKGQVDRSSHWKGNPGFPSSSEAGRSPPPATFQSHENRERETLGAGYEQHERAEAKGTRLGSSHGFGHSIGQRAGKHRLSGHPGAHRIGKR